MQGLLIVSKLLVERITNWKGFATSEVTEKFYNIRFESRYVHDRTVFFFSFFTGSRDLADDVCFKTDIEMNMHSWEVLRLELWKICLEYTFNP